MSLVAERRSAQPPVYVARLLVDPGWRGREFDLLLEAGVKFQIAARTLADAAQAAGVLHELRVGDLAAQMYRPLDTPEQQPGLLGYWPLAELRDQYGLPAAAGISDGFGTRRSTLRTRASSSRSS